MHNASTSRVSDSREPSIKDWEHSVQLNRWFLKPIGAWPLSNSATAIDRILSLLLTACSCFLIGFLLVPCALCTVMDRDGDLDTKIKMIGPLSFCIMAAIKHYVLLSRGPDIGRCIEHVRNDWKMSERSFQDREIMNDSAKFGRFLAAFCAVFMYSGGFFYTTVMPLCAKRTEIIDNETVRSQAFPIYRGLLDPRTTPSFEIVQFLQCLAGFVVYTVTISACSLAAVFSMHACGQLRILTERLENLVTGNKRANEASSADGRMGDIVETHLRILSFVTCVEELLNEIFLVEFVGCTLNICFLGYYVMAEWEQNETIASVTYCTLLISFTFNIFILCYIGEILAEQCKKIGLTSYMIDWYKLPGKKALSLNLVIAMSNSSVKLTAGKFVELSLASFCGVIKSSLAYLSLLRTLTI